MTVALMMADGASVLGQTLAVALVTVMAGAV